MMATLVGLAVDAPPCANWLLAQVERARARAELPALVVRCPAPDVVEGGLPDAPVARLSGFAAGDPWVGAALIALVETRRAIAAAWSPPARDPERAARYLLVPALGVLGGATQIGGEAVADRGGWTAGAGAAYATTSSKLGAVDALDLIASAGVPRPLLDVGALRLTATPRIGAGVTRIMGSAAGSAIAVHPAIAAVAVASLDLGLETRASAGAFAVGLRVGFRVGRAATADGEGQIPGAAVTLGGYVALGWSP